MPAARTGSLSKDAALKAAADVTARLVASDTEAAAAAAAAGRGGGGAAPRDQN
jgi:hypothetical protein